MNNTCKKCGEVQFSISDKNYLSTFGNCWLCDKKAWEAGTLPLEELEKREFQALSEPRVNTAVSAAGAFNLQ